MRKRTLEEQEVVITWNAKDRLVNCFVSVPAIMHKLDKMCEENPEAYRCIETDKLGDYKRYEFSAKRISYRRPASEARKEAGRKAALRHGFTKRASDAPNIVEENK